jgi:predicted site-specific integrase-resolvase
VTNIFAYVDNLVEYHGEVLEKINSKFNENLDEINSELNEKDELMMSLVT